MGEASAIYVATKDVQDPSKRALQKDDSTSLRGTSVASKTFAATIYNSNLS